MGAFPALEDDMHYALMYKKYFFEKGTPLPAPAL
jgi:hypothetical protein